MAFRVNLSQLYDLAENINDAIKNEVAREVATEVLERVERKSPRLTGKLASNWNLTQQGENWIIENDTDYARFVIEGTKPHIIRAKNASVLSFNMNGTTIFAKEVRHPGTAPNDFVDEAINEVESNIASIVERALREAGIK